MTKSLLCCWMLSIQYLSNNNWCVWITASCSVTSLHANVSLLLRWQQFSFDMQMFWLEEFRSFSAALKPLHYRGGIWGMSSSRGFRTQQKSVIREMLLFRRPQIRTDGLSLSDVVSFPPEWRNQERDCGFSLTPPDWNPWVDIEPQQQFSLLTSQALQGIRCCCVEVIITADLCSFFLTA